MRRFTGGMLPGRGEGRKSFPIRVSRAVDLRGEFRNQSRSIMGDIASLIASATAQVDAADSIDALETQRVQLLGKQGQITGLLKQLGRSEEHKSELQSLMRNSYAVF